MSTTMPTSHETQIKIVGMIFSDAKKLYDMKLNSSNPISNYIDV
jgi:hypothetical protein